MEAVANTARLIGREKSEKKKPKKDFYTETPVRKLGFLDEYGEALRPILSASSKSFVKQLPNIAYIPAIGYIVADVADKYQKGLDGTGEKPSAKMAAREAAYQGIVSLAAPMAIIKGTHKLTGKLVEKSAGKVPEGFRNATNGALSSLKKNKAVGKIISKAGMPGKIASAALGLFALSHLTKPVDAVVKKFFEKIVDPKIGVTDDKKQV